MKSKRNIVLFYHIPTGFNLSDQQMVRETDMIKEFCHKSDWNPVQTYVDRTPSASMHKTMLDFIADPDNSISAYFCVTAKSGFSKSNSNNITSMSTINSEAEKFRGGIPFGYKQGYNGALELDEERAVNVADIFHAKAGGDSLQRIADTLNRKGVKSSRGIDWTRQTIAYLLKNPCYCGAYNYKGKTINVPKIVSRQLFNKCQ